jgi:mRNA interferase MazF
VRRGDLVTVSAPGNYGKPRPAVIVQSDWLAATDSVLVALLTSALVDAPLYRLTIEPSDANGLKTSSQVMIDKIVAIPRKKCGRVIGRLSESERIALNHMLAVVVGIAD